MNSYLLKAVEDWAYAKFGLVILSNQQQKVIVQVMQYLKEKNWDLQTFLSALNAGDKQVTEKMVSLLTIQESYFFRDVSLFRLLREAFLPTLIQQKKLVRNKSITIWSAGCACGEELYSIAILLSELMPDIENWHLTLLGTDINVEALSKARQGVYSNIALRSVDDKVLTKYFVTEGKKYQLIEPIRKMATFAYGNLLEKSHFVGCVDFILCRNVFIYFDEASVKKALSYFDDALQGQGVLFLGCSDFVRYYQQQFSMNFKDSVTYLTKRVADTSKVMSQQTSSPPKSSYIEQQAQRRLEYQALDTLLINRQFMDVIDAVDKETKMFKSNPMLYRYKGEALIGIGDIVTAKEMLEKVVIQDKIRDPICCFLLALVLLKENEARAIQYFLEAAALKKAFPEAYYYLAMLALGNQKKEEGLQYLEQAARYAKEESKEKRVIASDGTMGELLAAVLREIAYYQEQS